MSEPIRIMVVDDHTVVRQGLVALLSTVPDLAVIAEAADGEEAVEMGAAPGQSWLVTPDTVDMTRRPPPVRPLTIAAEPQNIVVDAWIEVGDVELDEQRRFAALIGEPLRRPRPLVLVAVGDGDAHAGVAERPRDAEADAGGPARDESDLARPIHRPSLSLRCF